MGLQGGRVSDEDMERLEEFRRDVGDSALLELLVRAYRLEEARADKLGATFWRRAANKLLDALGEIDALECGAVGPEEEAPRCVPHGAIWCTCCTEGWL